MVSSGAFGAERFDPGGGVGELAQRGDAAVQIEPQHVSEFRVQRSSRLAGNPSVVPRHQQAAVVEDPKLVGLRLHLEVLADLPPQVALHGLGSTVLPAHVQRKSLRGMADEVRAQQGVDRLSIASRQGLVQSLGRRSGVTAGLDGHVRPRT